MNFEKYGTVLGERFQRVSDSKRERSPQRTTCHVKGKIEMVK